MAVMFRSDNFYGNSGHTPTEILAYECLNLGNMYILEELLSKVEKYLSKTEIADANWLIAATKKKIVKSNDENLDYTVYLPVFKSTISGLEKLLGMKINYLMWLGHLDDILELYTDDYTDYLKEIDAYETGKLIFEVPCDGNLYAYEEKPKPLSKDIVRETLDNTKGLYKVYVYPGIGHELQTIYFNHYNVSIEEVAAYCVYNNIGWVLSDEDYIFETSSLDSEDERFVYVDLSEKGLNNCWLCVEHMRCDSNTEIIF